MGNEVLVRVWIALGLTALGVSGLACKGAVTAPATASPPDLTADALGLMVLRAGTDPDLPSREIHADIVEGSDQRVIRDDDIDFNDTIALPIAGEYRGSVAPIFFAWDRGAFGPIIESAFYSLREHDDTNLIGGEPKVNPASFDEVTGRFYVPFADLFRDQEETVDSATLYTLRLDLILIGHDPVHINVNFHVLGKLPVARYEALPLKTATDLPQFAYGFEQTHLGHVLYRERVTNPSKHSVLLWASSSANEVTLTTEISERFRTAEQLSFLNHHSSAAFEVSAVRFTSGGQSDVRPIGPGEWANVPLGPHESVELEWMATPAAGAAVCQLPKTEIIREVFFSILHEFLVTGAEFDGPWSRDLRLTDDVPGMQRAKRAPNDYSVALFPRISAAGSSLNFAAELVGEKPQKAGSSAWTCQGLF